jgi:hypothetical protein
MAILHCGDITDSGTPEQLALYQSTVPAELVSVEGKPAVAVELATGKLI